MTVAMSRLRKFIAFCSALLMAFCLAAAAGETFIKLFLSDGTPITIELAVTPIERELGLMFRDRIEPDQGMLFVFETEDRSAFWMFNVKFPIDILWLDAHKRVVHIAAGVPPCPREPCPSYPPPTPALYVLELKSGQAAAHKIKVGDRLEFILPKTLK